MAEAMEDKPVKIDTKTQSLACTKPVKPSEMPANAAWPLPPSKGTSGISSASGELDIFQLMQREQVEKWRPSGSSTTISAAAKAFFGDKYSYGQIKMVLDYMRIGKEE